MAKTKKDYITELVGLGVDGGGLDELTTGVLKDMVAKRKEAIAEADRLEEERTAPTELVEVVEEETIESEPVIEAVAQEEVAPVIEEEVIEPTIEGMTEFVSEEIKLRVHDVRVYSLHPTTKCVTVTNEGGGDVLVSGDLLRISKHDTIRPGDTKKFVGVGAVLIRSASRPTLTIKQYR